MSYGCHWKATIKGYFNLKEDLLECRDPELVRMSDDTLYYEYLRDGEGLAIDKIEVLDDEVTTVLWTTDRETVMSLLRLVENGGATITIESEKP